MGPINGPQGPVNLGPRVRFQTRRRRHSLSRRPPTSPPSWKGGERRRRRCPPATGSRKIAKQYNQLLSGSTQPAFSPSD
uniref:Uncharacterized protein n=1 Tax=Oryza nivara TaxID=4536 RepID=A0A0E0HM54_ORYNI